MRKGYKELTYTKRIELETLFKIGHSKYEAAKLLNVSLKTIYNECHRGKYIHTNSDLTTEVRYSAQIAQDKRDYNVTARGTIPKVLKDKKLAKAIEEKIVDKGYSPEVAIETMVRSGEMDKYEESVCVKTVYNSIDKGFFSKITNKDLPVKRNKNKKDYKKIHRIKKACAGTSIEDRPEDILEREEFGHMEMDSVIGKREKGSTLLTIIERKTRNIIVKKQPDKTSKSVVETLDELERELGDVFYKLFKTITVDNGTEFADCAGIERSCVYPGRKRTKVYYCHPYASCERGSNENGNRMIRRKIPKGTSINGYSKEEIQQIEDWVNEYPRTIIARFSYIYGPVPYMPNTAFYEFINKAERGEDITLNNSDIARRDNIYVEDAVRGVVLIAEKGISGESYNVSSNGDLGNFKAVDEMAQIISHQINETLNFKTQVKYLSEKSENRKPGICMDNNKLKQLGWNIEYSIEQGIKETINYYLNN